MRYAQWKQPQQQNALRFTNAAFTIKPNPKAQLDNKILNIRLSGLLSVFLFGSFFRLILLDRDTAHPKTDPRM